MHSGAIFEIVALSATFKKSSPSPKNSTNLPTTPSFLSYWVIESTKSVAVTLLFNFPFKWTPKTLGKIILILYPSITLSASIPPTPQPNTPSPFIIVVWESAPTKESGYNTFNLF